MTIPRWLIAGALVFWGWQTGFLISGLVMAAALEASHFISARWEFKEADLNRVCDLCWLLLLGSGIILGSTEDRVVFVFKFIQTLPVCFFPIILAQTYGNQEMIPVSAFYWLLRRGYQGSKTVQIAFAYFALCVAGSSASTQANSFFYPGIAVLVLLALAGARPRHVSLPLWILLAGLVGWAGQIGHQRLRGLQNKVEGALAGWVAELWQSPEIYERRTRIGHVGKLSQSRKVLVRVRVPPGQIPPSLLREAVFDTYTNQVWSVRSNYNRLVSAHRSDGSFILLPFKHGSVETEISSYFESGRGTLALPHGVFEIDGVTASLHTNDLGVCFIEGSPGLVTLRAHYGGGPSLDAPPGPSDLVVPASEKPVLETIANSLKLSDMSDRLKIRAVTHFFLEGHFTYSLSLPNHRFPKNRFTELGWFLTQSRAGHCEYFATATVLLLRQAGVPARYVTGFAVPESARRGDTYLVRERHQHAWALVYHADTRIWEQIDTTPSHWDEADAAPGWWGALSDFLSNLLFDYSKWRWSKDSLARDAEWVLASIGLYLTWRILSSQRRRATDPASAQTPPWPGADSELYLIHQRLEGGQLARLPNESLGDWQRRLEEASPTVPALRRIFHLHHRLRFDPRGLATADRQILKREVESWLADFAMASAHRGQAR